MAESNGKNSLYVDDFMSKEEEEIKVPYSVIKDKQSFNEKKENFNIEKVLNEFVLK